MVAWTETGVEGKGVDERKEVVLASWVNEDETMVYWPLSNSRWHLVNDSVPNVPNEDRDVKWGHYPVDEVRLRNATEEECEDLLKVDSQVDAQVSCTSKFVQPTKFTFVWQSTRNVWEQFLSLPMERL